MACVVPIPDTGGETTVATPTTTTTTTRTTITTVPTTSTVTTPTFTGEVLAVDAARLGHSWRQGCPVGPEELRLVTVTHWDFSGTWREGAVVVHADHAQAVLGVFRDLFEAGFPIESVTPVGDLDPETIDDPGQNNTSGFNCRFVAGTTAWSEHARGLAIDLNPQQNPLVDGPVIDPPEAHRYADRTLDEPGMIHPDGPVVEAFGEIGWVWGGDWQTKKDYHHFSATGR